MNLPDTLQQTADLLHVNHTMSANVEYPGCIIVSFPWSLCDTYFIVGNANGTWDVDVYADAASCENGEQPRMTLKTNVASTSDEAPRIARAVSRAILECAAFDLMRLFSHTFNSTQELASRALIAIEESDDADEHADLLAELRAFLLTEEDI